MVVATTSLLWKYNSTRCVENVGIRNQLLHSSVTNRLPSRCLGIDAPSICVSGACPNIFTYFWLAWLIIMGSRFDDWVCWHFFTITVNYNISHTELLLNDVCFTNLCEEALTDLNLSNSSQSQSHIATNGQSVSKSWCRAPFGAYDQIFSTVCQLRSCFFFCGAPLWRQMNSLL
jgi:hypothetical protein